MIECVYTCKFSDVTDSTLDMKIRIKSHQGILKIHHEHGDLDNDAYKQNQTGTQRIRSDCFRENPQETMFFQYIYTHKYMYRYRYEC